MLKKLGWWAIGVGLELVGVAVVFIGAMLASGAVAAGGTYPILNALAALLVLAGAVAVLAAPGYVAARFGEGATWMGLAVGAFAATITIAITVPVIENMSFFGGNEAARSVSLFEAVVLIPPPVVGAWWARREASRDAGISQAMM